MIHNLNFHDSQVNDVYFLFLYVTQCAAGTSLEWFIVTFRIEKQDVSISQDISYVLNRSCKKMEGYFLIIVDVTRHCIDLYEYVYRGKSIR